LVSLVATKCQLWTTKCERSVSTVASKPEKHRTGRRKLKGEGENAHRRNLRDESDEEDSRDEGLR
jgi:hypothetical protein